MRWRGWWPGLAVVAAVLALSTGPAFGQEFKFRFGGSDPGRGLLDRSTVKFVELSERISNGRIKWEYFCCDQLGGDITQIEQMMANSIQGYGDVLDWWANWVKDFSIFGWGFTFRDKEHMARFLESPAYRAMVDQLREQNGVRILAAGPTEPRVLFTKKPVTGLAGLAGMKMRVPEIKAYLAVWEALGTRPSRVTWGEVYLALKTGVVEGCEGPVSAAYGVKLHEAAPNIALTNHIISSAQIAMNEGAYQSLPPDLRKAVEEAARDAVAWARLEGDRASAETLKKMEAEGGKVAAIDVRPFQERLGNAVGKAEADGLWSRGLWQTVQATK
jgi:TRAP-type C4-dicarboxylate transport system substrate-binding protein